MAAKKKANIRKAVVAQAKGTKASGVRSETRKSKAGEMDARESKYIKWVQI